MAGGGWSESSSGNDESSPIAGYAAPTVRRLCSGSMRSFRKKRRELGTTSESGLLVDRTSVLPDSARAPSGERGDRLVLVPLEQHERYLALGGREVPVPELCIDRSGKPVERGLRARHPCVALLSLLLERHTKRRSGMRGAPPAEPQCGRHHECAGDHEGLEHDVKRKPPLRMVHREIDRAADDDRQQGNRKNPMQPSIELGVHPAPMCCGASVI